VNEISLVTITLNEEANIARCIQSARELADEVLVVDSFSTDRTLDIARQLGARVLQHPFEGHIQQKEWAIAQAAHDRVLFMDADEALSPELQAAIREVKDSWPHDCYWCNRLSQMGGRWIRHGAWYPDRKMRLFDRRKYRTAGINPHDKFVPIAGASAGRLRGDLLHYTNSDIHDRALTINKLSTHAARAYHEGGKRGSWLRLLTKPRLRFFSEYVLRGGCLDGFYGFVIAKTSAQYVFLRESKLLEIQRQEKARDSR
jgi:glycosyltransferase involved in cell wall biosynthesis